MKRVVFSASVRFSDQCQEWAEVLRGTGVQVYVPTKEVADGQWDVMSLSRRRSLQKQLIEAHHREIDEADILFVLNQDGYIGSSVTLEIGYALGLGKLVYAMQPDVELGRDVMYAGYCKTPAELLAVLQ